MSCRTLLTVNFTILAKLKICKVDIVNTYRRYQTLVTFALEKCWVMLPTLVTADHKLLRAKPANFAKAALFMHGCIWVFSCMWRLSHEWLAVRGRLPKEKCANFSICWHLSNSAKIMKFTASVQHTQSYNLKDVVINTYFAITKQTLKQPVRN